MQPALDTDAVLGATLADELTNILAALPARDADLDAAVTHAVAHYCATHGRELVLSPDAVALLAAKAYAGLANEAAASAILASRATLAPLAGIVRVEAVSPAAVSLLASGVLRFAQGTAWGARLAVVFDLRRLRPTADGLLELAAVPSLHRLVDWCDAFWLEGNAVLGLRGLRLHRAHFPRSKARDPWVQAIQDRLAARAEREGWRSVPPVIELD